MNNDIKTIEVAITAIENAHKEGLSINPNAIDVLINEAKKSIKYHKYLDLMNKIDPINVSKKWYRFKSCQALEESK